MTETPSCGSPRKIPALCCCSYCEFRRVNYFSPKKAEKNSQNFTKDGGFGGFFDGIRLKHCGAETRSRREQANISDNLQNNASTKCAIRKQGRRTTTGNDPPPPSH